MNKLYKIVVSTVAVVAAVLSLFGFLVLLPYAIVNAHPVATIVTYSIMNLLSSLLLFTHLLIIKEK